MTARVLASLLLVSLAVAPLHIQSAPSAGVVPNPGIVHLSEPSGDGAFAVPEATRGEAVESTHFISGTVRAAPSVRPLEGATVTLSPGDFSALTDTRGRFRFTVPSGAYLLRGTKEGYRESWSRVIPALPGTVLTRNLFLVPEPARPGPITIDVPGDIPGIQDAVHAADDGDRVRIAPGYFEENVFVERSITIEGASPRKTIIDARGLGSVLAVAAPNVTVRGVTLFRGDWGVYVQEDGFHLSDSVLYLNQQGLRTTEVEGGVVERVVFLDNWERALHLARTTGYAFHHDTFVGNGEVAFLFEARRNSFYSNDFLGESGGFSGDPDLQNPWENQWSLNGRGNYWEAYGGEDLDGDGVGDTLTPHGSVDLHPLTGPVATVEEPFPLEVGLLVAAAGVFLFTVLAPRATRRRGPRS